MALAMGLFALVDSLLIRPLPYKDPERIVHLDAPLSRFSGRTREALDVRSLVQSSGLISPAFVRRLAVFQEGGVALTTMGLRPVFVSSSFFTLLGVEPALGRRFDDLDVAARPRRVILSHAVWRDHYGAAPDILERAISIDGALEDDFFVVIGVMPQGFAFPNGSNFWLPFRPPDSSGPTLVPDFARLPPSVTVGEFQARVPQVTVTSLAEYVRPGTANTLVFVFVAALLLLVVTWAQVSSLLQVRAFDRVSESDVKLALGATPFDLYREIAIEGAILGLAAAALASSVAVPIAQVLSALVVSPTLGLSVSLDYRVLAFACVVQAVGVFVWVGLSHSVARRMSSVGRAHGQRSTIVTGAGTLRLGFFVVQIAVATALVTLTGASVETFRRSLAVDLGLVPQGLFAFAMPPPVLREGADPAAVGRFRQAALESLAVIRGLDGVVSASFVTYRPLEPANLLVPVVIDERTDLRVELLISQIGRGFVSTVGTRLIEGREASQAEAEPQQVGGAISRVALANHALAGVLRKNGPVVGQVVNLSEGSACRIVGVIPNIEDGTIDGKVHPTIYPYLSDRSNGQVLLARVRNLAVAAGIQSQLQAIWGPLRKTREFVHLDDVAQRALADHSRRSKFLATLAALSVAVMLGGITSTVDYLIKSSSKDLAIRLAMGATPNLLLVQFVMRTLVMAIIGITLGLAAGYSLVAGSNKVIPGVAVQDPLVVLTGGLCVLLSAAIAAWWSARIVRRVHPSALFRVGR